MLLYFVGKGGFGTARWLRFLFQVFGLGYVPVRVRVRFRFCTSFRKTFFGRRGEGVSFAPLATRRFGSTGGGGGHHHPSHLLLELAMRPNHMIGARGGGGGDTTSAILLERFVYSSDVIKAPTVCLLERAEHPNHAIGAPAT